MILGRLGTIRLDDDSMYRFRTVNNEQKKDLRGGIDFKQTQRKYFDSTERLKNLDHELVRRLERKNRSLEATRDRPGSTKNLEATDGRPHIFDEASKAKMVKAGREILE